MLTSILSLFFFFNDTATTEFYTLSLHDALPIRPYQRPHPPIGVAGVSAKSETLVLAGERGYIQMSINFVPPRILRTHWDAVAAGAQRGGRVGDPSRWGGAPGG